MRCGRAWATATDASVIASGESQLDSCGYRGGNVETQIGAGGM